jgi:hypothetical protein
MRAYCAAVAAFLISTSIAAAQQPRLDAEGYNMDAQPPADTQGPVKSNPDPNAPILPNATPGQSFRDDRLQSDRGSAMAPTPRAPETTGQSPKNGPDPNPLPGEQPRPIPR